MKGLGFYESDFIKIKEDKDVIAESVTRILMTTPGERVGRPDFGCGLRYLLFESLDDIYVDDVKAIIVSAIEKYEPRIILENIELTASEHTLYVKIYFQMIGNPLDTDLLEYNFNLEA